MVVDIIVRTFDTNPGVNWMFKKSGHPRNHLRNLANYAFMKAYSRGGAYLSDNGKGVALCFKHNAHSSNLLEYYYQLKLAFCSIGFKRLHQVLKRESYRNAQRPRSGEYLYFWFLGVMDKGAGAAFELKQELFRLATAQKLPIYLETSLMRNQKAYEKFGFETYHYWENEKEDIRFWFMKWEPATNH